MMMVMTMMMTTTWQEIHRFYKSIVNNKAVIGTYPKLAALQQ
jgi:hypothetical protein